MTKLIFKGKESRVPGSALSQLKDLPDISQFSKFLSYLTTFEATSKQNLLYQKSSTTLLVRNQIYTKTLNYFIM